MRGHNICLNGGIRKIISESSSLPHLIWSSVKVSERTLGSVSVAQSESGVCMLNRSTGDAKKTPFDFFIVSFCYYYFLMCYAET